MPGELQLPLRLGKIAADAGSQGCALDQASDVPVGQPVRANLFGAFGNAPEQRPVRDAGELEPGLESDDRTGGVAGATADFDLAPADLDLGPNDRALVENLDPAGAVFGVVGTAVEAGDFGAAQAAGKADQQDGAVA